MNLELLTPCWISKAIQPIITNIFYGYITNSKKSWWWVMATVGHPPTQSWLSDVIDQLIDKIWKLWMILGLHGWKVVVVLINLLLLDEWSVMINHLYMEVNLILKVWEEKKLFDVSIIGEDPMVTKLKYPSWGSYWMLLNNFVYS